MPGVAVKGRDKAGDRQGKTVKHDWFRLTTPGASGSSDPVITAAMPSTTMAMAHMTLP